MSFYFERLSVEATEFGDLDLPYKVFREILRVKIDRTLEALKLENSAQLKYELEAMLSERRPSGHRHTAAKIVSESKPESHVESGQRTTSCVDFAAGVQRVSNFISLKFAGNKTRFAAKANIGMATLAQLLKEPHRSRSITWTAVAEAMSTTTDELLKK